MFFYANDNDVIQYGIVNEDHIILDIRNISIPVCHYLFLLFFFVFYNYTYMQCESMHLLYCTHPHTFARSFFFFIPSPNLHIYSFLSFFSGLFGWSSTIYSTCIPLPFDLRAV
ncbi:hypothetical protein C2G38_2116545 [Gigaspora rosea]|uniref:Uncharacterized protein n=1 Tax=Gigaspora rosea TaxID=44941 RepID=A0A397U963_9GLOM|nr:hypothetical protein C2G38_2116545 [Gigaspora rosea]